MVDDDRVQALARMTLRDILLRFEQDFDVPMRHHEALGVLEARNGFEHDDLAIRVGSWWARIVQCDVKHALLQGLEAAAESRTLVTRLDAEMASDEFGGYVLARWHDAVGRIQFRCGDMQAARIEFEAAEGRMALHGLWYCEPDVVSNLLRARFDERAQVNDNTTIARSLQEFRRLYDQGIVVAEKWGFGRTPVMDEIEASLRDFLDDKAMADPILPAAIASTSVEPYKYREHARGLANVCHNRSVVAAPNNKRNWSGDLEEAQEYAWLSCQLAFGLGDGYRFAQALRQAATLSTDKAESTRWLHIVHDRLPWQRGRWMVAQQLALREPAEKGRARLDRVLNQLAERQRARGGDLGFDVDVHRYTVDRLEELGGDADRIRRLRLEAIRNIRRVIKVSTYRQRHAEVIYPIVLSEIERAYDAAVREPARVELAENMLALVEEASAREVLDFLSSRAPSHDDHVVQSPQDSTQAPIIAAKGGVRGETVRARIGATAYDEIARSRLEFENRALYRPIESAAADHDIAASLRRYTARDAEARGAAHREVKDIVVRYFLAGFEPKRGRPSKLRAMIVRDGHVSQDALGVELDLEAMLELGRRPFDHGPTVQIARDLWDVLIRPLWPHIDPDRNDHIIIIPARGMFALPLQIAMPEGTAVLPLGAEYSLSFAVSATAHVTRNRSQYKEQPVDHDDNLCALVPGDADIYPGELEGLDEWKPGQFHLAGARPQGVTPDRFTWWGAGDRKGLDRLLARSAEFFIYAGHGISVDGPSGVDVALRLAGGEFLTQYHLAGEVSLRRNKLALIGACVSGLGGDTSSGEVAGFVRSFIGAGCGALAVTKWRVRDVDIARVGFQLLSKISKRRGQTINLAEEIRNIHRAGFTKNRLEATGYEKSRNLLPEEPLPSDDPVVNGLHACPLALYL